MSEVLGAIHSFIKVGMRARRSTSPQSKGRGGRLQHGSHTHQLFLSKQIPVEAIQTRTNTDTHTDPTETYTHTRTLI